MSPPPKEKRGCDTALKTDRVTGAYHFPPFLQPLGNGRNGGVKSRRDRDRRCAVCQTIACNDSLGGSDHASAFYDPIYCFKCADRSRPFVFNVRGVR